MAKRPGVITMSPLVLDKEDDLDLWEVVNPSDGEFSDDSFSVDSLSDDDVISVDDDEEEGSVVSLSVISPLSQTLPAADAVDLDSDGDVDGDHGDDDVVRDEVDDIDLGWAQRQILFIGAGGGSHGVTYGDCGPDDGEEGDCGTDDGEEEDRGGEDGDYDDSYDLEEELIPRSVNKKIGRQRMRKLGKRAIAKVYASKMTPYSHLKKYGCVRGKHGLGMKFKC
ncbi:PREDICTED: prostatic spermine-binding protein-like [Camelina sativa]|uniref:Prostatic spermine-binding protein-like n=1 Tax=Camelina sativa TaxID=90675 RepID=A0ABM0TW87_CAMSA|nr:PREDICTED: prostatic spermine-binding protein-like [Camelina sativa]